MADVMVSLMAESLVIAMADLTVVKVCLMVGYLAVLLESNLE